MAEHNELGSHGEALAMAELQKKGYIILEKNWRYQKAEIDIIACNFEFVIAVEVKTRSSITFGNPQDFVNPQKIKRLVVAMHHYVISNKLDHEVRFDIIAITKNRDQFKLDHLEGAFHAFD